MDSTGRLGLLGDQKGLALIYIALLMVAFCAFLGLAVDIGYMYVAKGQLQNAADSAALAGASGLPDQAGARAKATAFAQMNPVVPNATVAVASGDITLGNWDRRNNPSFNPAGTPVNAVKVEAKRTDGSVGGPIDLFFSRIVDDRWSQMGVSATAIAQRPVRAGAYIMIDTTACSNPSTISPPLSLNASTNNMAWTSLLSTPTGPGITVNDLIRGYVVPDVDVCTNQIYSTNGTAGVFKDTEAVFYDPDYDRINKTLDGSGGVSTWTIIVPYADDPADQTKDPHTVLGYAKIRIIRACGTGGGNPFNGFRAPAGVCAGGENDIVIDQITCVTCENSSNMLGAKPSLVQ